jgi:hypothetical protein
VVEEGGVAEGAEEDEEDEGVAVRGVALVIVEKEGGLRMVLGLGVGCSGYLSPLEALVHDLAGLEVVRVEVEGEKVQVVRVEVEAKKVEVVRVEVGGKKVEVMG